ncbi:hypothetical protein [Nocardia brasiliensis]|uniref:hypothetical protein n=1 Tax=Nocardia brasiliensis TaxID=37326 RepID=UPI002454757E|nr:hypothetical protein [Nocardia brasiliensis]
MPTPLLHAGEHIDDLTEEFEQEQDPRLRCWLLELIAEAQSPAGRSEWDNFVIDEFSDG